MVTDSWGHTVTTAYDLAGRPLSEVSNVGGTLISAVSYNARDQEVQATLGNGMTETRSYDPRGRTVQIQDYLGTHLIPGSPGTGSIEVDGSEQTRIQRPCYAGDDCTIYDDGTVWGTIAGVQHTASYGEGDDNTSVAQSLAWALNGSVVHASASGNIVNITAATNGSNTNYSLSAGSQSNESMSSFTATASGPYLTGVSYAPDGNLLGATDKANGTWTYSYNLLNQLTQACTPSCGSTVLGYSYDRYGNRWSAPTVSLAFHGANNRADSLTYDAAGNVINDGTNGYTYDAGGRITSVYQGSTTLATYVYDAEGRRVHENVGGVVKEYVNGASGQELTVVDGSQNLIRGETYFDGRLLGTQEASAFVWAHADELGTVRLRTNSAGSAIETDTSWPFGAHLNAVGSYSSLHLTGKYRDGESGLDYFGARYYSSALGRFMTPDWSAVPEAVPYAGLENPQSLNLYAYVQNDPVTATDPDGHICFLGIGNTCGKASKGSVKEGGAAGAAAADGVLNGSLDVTGILDGLKSLGDAITTGISSFAALPVAVLALEQPAGSTGEAEILRKSREEDAAQLKA